MKKLLSLSLVASATILSINASAQDLSEAIKNVDVSGTMAYRYNDYETNSGNGQTTTNNYKIAINTKSIINDDFTANTRIIAESFDQAVSAADTEMTVELSEANFTYTGFENASLTLGKQAINTAFTVGRDSIGTDAHGNGIVGTYNFGSANVYAAYFQNQNFNGGTSGQNDTNQTITGGEAVVSYGVAASFSNINVDASYVDVEDVFDAYTIGLSADYKAGDIDLSSYARYSALDLDNATTDNALWKVGVSATYDIFNAYVAYGQTDKEGGVVGVDASATTGFDEHWRVTLSTIRDASVIYTGVSAQVTDTINVALKYSDLDADSTTDTQDEIYTQVVYQPSKNFFTYVRLGVLDREAYSEDVTIGRLHVQYSF